MSSRRRSRQGRWAGLLVLVLVVGGGVLPRRAASSALSAASAQAPAALHPQWRGDAANSGDTLQTGPVVTPTVVFTAQPVRYGVTTGVVLDGAGTLYGGTEGGSYFAYSPAGTALWSAPTVGTTGGTTACPPSTPSLSSAGALYVGTDAGALVQIDPTTGSSAVIWQTASGAGVTQTPQVGADGTLYVGTAAGQFVRLQPPALGSGLPATVLSTVTAPGALQTTGPYSGTTSTAPFSFCGEAALDGAGTAYVASSDTNPATGVQALGTLAAIRATGTVAWQAPLQGAVAGAVVYAANPLTPTHPLVLVADGFPEVAAFDAATGARVWDVVPPSPSGFQASPALSPDGRTVYVANSSDTLYAFDVATGAPVVTFGRGGQVALLNGTSASPLVDAAGTLYVADNTGALNAYSAAGVLLWRVPGGLGAGQSGSTSAQWSSPALDGQGTLYVGGNGGQVRGFSATISPPPSPSASPALAGPSGDTWSELPSTDGYTHRRLFSSPVGLVAAAGWRFRDPTLITPTTTPPAGAALPPPAGAAPAALPFSVTLPTRSDQPVTLTNEAGVHLGLALAPSTGGTPAGVAVPAQPSTSTVRYPGALAGGADLTLQPTTSGLDVRLTLHSLQEAGPITLTLQPDPGLTLRREATGTLVATRALTTYGDDGSPMVIHQPDYVLRVPSVRESRTDLLTQVSSGPVTATLTATDTATPLLTLTVDPSWLAAAPRVFPLRLDLLVETAYSAVQTGDAHTVSSCAPDQPAVETVLVVGNVGGCMLRGLLSVTGLTLGAVPPHATVVSATLHAYTPDHTGPTGVVLYPTAALPLTAAVPPPWQALTWNTAPALITSTTGITQLRSASHWQTWDITPLVQQWVQGRALHGGLALVSAAAPVRFVTARGADGGSPSLAPYIDLTLDTPTGGSMITAAPQAGTPRVAALALAARARARLATATTSASGEGATTIYGLSGTFAPDAWGCALAYTATNCLGRLSMNVARGLRASYVRASVYLSCVNNTPGYAYWNGGNRDNVPVYDLIDSASANHLIPVITFVQDDTCATSQDWAAQMQYFVRNMQHTNPGLAMIYFEIGNEPNCCGHPNYVNYGTNFAEAAGALNTFLPTQGFTNYRILTAGMFNPTADYTCGDQNLQVATNAILRAEGAGYHVPLAHLGLAAHPYSYSTNDAGFWLNYYKLPGNHYQTYCQDLGFMLSTWIQAVGDVPIVFTEDNYTTVPSDSAQIQQYTNSEAAYMVDLFTWLHHFNGYDSWATSPVRVLWFSPIDVPTNPGFRYLGLYTWDRGPAAGGVRTINTAIPSQVPGWYFAHCGLPGLNNVNPPRVTLSRLYLTLVRQLIRARPQTCY